MFTSKGYLKYHPPKEGSHWLTVECCQGIVDYYLHCLKKYERLIVNKPAWRSHITVVRAESLLEQYQPLWGFNDGAEIDFNCLPNRIETNFRFWWIKVECPYLTELRKEFGLTKPSYSYHITIAQIFWASLLCRCIAESSKSCEQVGHIFHTSFSFDCEGYLHRVW